jgi:formyl-CoA transferase/CoA:oxalate CoA-transferase
VPVSLVDMGTGMWAVTGILAALRERDRTGQGVEVTTALFDTALAWIAFQTNNYLASGEPPRPQGSGAPMIAPYEAFPAADGWVMIAAASDALFARACAALGRPGLAADPRFETNPRRVEHREALAAALAEVTRALGTGEVVERLQRAGVPVAPIQRVDQVARHPQTEAAGMLPAVKHPRLPDYRTTALPIRWDGERPPPGRVPPLLGEHTADVLAELGYDEAAVEDLRRRDVIAL